MRKHDNNPDNLDRAFFGQPGCMAILIILGIGYIIYNIYFK